MYFTSAQQPTMIYPSRLVIRVGEECILYQFQFWKYSKQLRSHCKNILQNFWKWGQRLLFTKTVLNSYDMKTLSNALSKQI